MFDTIRLLGSGQYHDLEANREAPSSASLAGRCSWVALKGSDLIVHGDAFFGNIFPSF
jgi:hypothetical protein